MQQPGLYFPYVHIRDEQWLKVAALYWPSIRRIVPDGYRKHDSPTAGALADAGILTDERPRYSPVWELAEAVRENADQLMERYSLKRAVRDWDGRRWAEESPPCDRRPQLGWIHILKAPPGLVRALRELGLVDVQSAPREHEGGDRGSWIGFHPVLAGAYMTALAADMSAERHFHPLTDQVDLSGATPNGPESAIRLLLGPQAARTVQDRLLVERLGVETYVMLAMQYARPKDVADAPIEKIIECRMAMADELHKFRDYVSSQRDELAALAGVPDERRRLEEFTAHVERTIEAPLRQLERGLALHKLEPTRSMLLAGSWAPPAAATAALDVAGAAKIAAGVGAVAAVGGAWWQVRTMRTSARATSPVGYLLDARDHLSPRTLPARMRRVFRGTYSPTQS